MDRLKYIALLLFVFTAVGCQDNLLNQPPKAAVDSKYSFNTAKDSEVATNDFYTMLPTTYVYMEDSRSDNIVPLAVDESIKGSRIVPTSSGSGGWSWSRLRDINFFLEHYQKVEDQAAKAKYSGIARFFRAFFYFQK